MIRKNLRHQKRNRRWLTFLMLFGILVPYLKTMMISFPKQVSAEPAKEEILLDNSSIKVTANHELQNDKMLWTISYQQMANTLAGSTQFKILDDNQNLPLENLTSESQANFADTTVDSWLSSKDISKEEVTNSIQFTVAPDANVQLYIQLERINDQGVKNFVLSERESGPYQLAVTTQSTTTSSTTSSSTSEVLKNTTSSSSSPLAGVSGAADSSKVSTKAVPTRAGEIPGEIDATQIILADDAVSWQMDVQVTGTAQHIVTKYDDATVANPDGGNATNSDPNHWEEATNREFHYRNFNTTEIAVGLDYDSDRDFGKVLGGTSNPVEISVSYDDVGYYQTKVNNRTVRKKLAAVATVSNIVIGKLPTWASGYGKGESTKAFILFSRNLFSGVYYGEIAKMDIEFVFKDADTGEIINFPDDGKSVLSFNSLNGFKDAYEEFAGTLSGNPKSGSTVDGSLIHYQSDGMPGRDYTKETYFGSTDGNPAFVDKLGDPKFSTASVTFNLKGTSNSFKFGSTDGRAWTSFSSSAVFPVQQSDPIKTVQTLKTDGRESDFSDREKNNLDIYPDGPDGEDYLADEDKINFPNVDARIIERGDIDPNDPNVADDKFYYFINQPTINLATQGLVLPTQMTIKDKLPEGITLADGAKSFTLYDQLGNEIGDEIEDGFTDQSARRDDMSLTLSDKATNQINTLSRDSRYFGKDFVIRIKVKPKNDNVSALEVQDDIRGIENRATSEFGYNNVDKPIASTSNSVNVKFKKNAFFKFVKQDGKTKTALPGATFSLSDYDTKNVVDTLESDENGLFTFTVPFELGKRYLLHEVDAPNGYALASDEIIEITEANDPTFTPPVNNDCDQHYIIFDEPANEEFEIKKVDESGKVLLPGATFELSDEIDEAGNLINPKSGETDDKGVISSWTGGKNLLSNNKTYYLKEKIAPTGYIGLTGYFKIVIDDNNRAKVSYIGNDSTINSTIETSTVNDTYTNIHTISFSIKNTPLPKVLPKTGGTGIRRFGFIGLNLVVLSTGYLLLRRRRKT